MGMFDSVYAKCPKCGADVEFQSKAGECCLKRYNARSVPPEIAKDIAGYIETCACGHQMRLVPARPIERVCMVVDDGIDNDWD